VRGLASLRTGAQDRAYRAIRKPWQSCKYPELLTRRGENLRRGLIVLAVTTALLRNAQAGDTPLTFIATPELATKTSSSDPGHWKFTVIDARTRVEYEEAHIPGAISIPAAKIDAVLPRRIKDRDRELIFYCNGPKCTKSQKAARAAIALGYRKVLEYNEGMPGWGKARMPIAGKPLPQVDVPAIAPEQLAAEISSGKHPFLLDVRDPREFHDYHLKGAVNIPLDEVEKRLGEIPKSAEIVIACHVGQQSIVGARLLSHLGVDRLERLDGGVVTWQQKGLPLETAAVPGTR